MKNFKYKILFWLSGIDKRILQLTKTIPSVECLKVIVWRRYFKWYRYVKKLFTIKKVRNLSINRPSTIGVKYIHKPRKITTSDEEN